MIKTICIFFTLLTALLLGGPAIHCLHGADTTATTTTQPKKENKTKEKTKPQPLFESDEFLDLELEYEINKFKKDKGLKRDYHNAKLSYTEKDGKRVSLDVQIKVRGKLRRKLLKCLVPPLKIKFDENQVKGTIFDGQKNIKMVVHCKNRPAFFEQYTLQEYLIYKAYNLLTEKSFRVRMARVTYKNSIGKKESFTKYAFFIENYKKMVQRLGANPVERESPITLPEADYDLSTLVSVFEYMIGNTDWSIRSSHNTVLFTMPGNDNLFYPVPFDFDQVGLIDAHYARPDLQLPIRSVRERLFRGYCKSETQFNKIFAIFKAHEKEIYAIFENFEPLPEKIRKRNVGYLQEFYEIINDPKLVKRYFIENYRGRPLPLR